MSLHYLIRKRILPAIRQLVENGVGVNSRDCDRRTPLMICCLEDDEKWATGIVRMLLQAGAQTAVADRYGRNALMFACLFDRPFIVQLLLKALTFDLTKRDKFGNTALHYAVMASKQEIVEELVMSMATKKVTLNHRNNLGHSASMLAKMQNKHNLMPILKVQQQSDFAAPKEVQRSRKIRRAQLSPGNGSSRLIEDPRSLRLLILKEVRDSVRWWHARGFDIKYAYHYQPKTDLPSDISCIPSPGEGAHNRMLIKAARRYSASAGSSHSKSSNFRCKSAPPSSSTSRRSSHETAQSWRQDLQSFLDNLGDQKSHSFRKPAVFPPTFTPMFYAPSHYNSLRRSSHYWCEDLQSMDNSNEEVSNASVTKVAFALQTDLPISTPTSSRCESRQTLDMPTTRPRAKSVDLESSILRVLLANTSGNQLKNGEKRRTSISGSDMTSVHIRNTHTETSRRVTEIVCSTRKKSAHSKPTASSILHTSFS